MHETRDCELRTSLALTDEEIAAIQSADDMAPSGHVIRHRAPIDAPGEPPADDVVPNDYVVWESGVVSEL